MARFEQRISDEQVEAAREQIKAGAATLRAAAAEIPCAASTLSVRIRKAEAAEAAARERAAGGGQDAPAPGRADYIRELQRIALGADPTATARDRLSAIKELLKLEPADSPQAAVGAVFNVYPDGTISAAGQDVVGGGDDGEDSSGP